MNYACAFAQTQTERFFLFGMSGKISRHDAAYPNVIVRARVKCET